MGMLVILRYSKENSIKVILFYVVLCITRFSNTRNTPLSSNQSRDFTKKPKVGSYIIMKIPFKTFFKVRVGPPSSFKHKLAIFANWIKSPNF